MGTSNETGGNVKLNSFVPLHVVYGSLREELVWFCCPAEDLKQYRDSRCLENSVVKAPFDVNGICGIQLESEGECLIGAIRGMLSRDWYRVDWVQVGLNEWNCLILLLCRRLPLTSAFIPQDSRVNAPIERLIEAIVAPVGKGTNPVVINSLVCMQNGRITLT